MIRPFLRFLTTPRSRKSQGGKRGKQVKFLISVTRPPPLLTARQAKRWQQWPLPAYLHTLSCLPSKRNLHGTHSGKSQLCCSHRCAHNHECSEHTYRWLSKTIRIHVNTWKRESIIIDHTQMHTHTHTCTCMHIHMHIHICGQLGTTGRLQGWKLGTNFLVSAFYSQTPCMSKSPFFAS